MRNLTVDPMSNAQHQIGKKGSEPMFLKRGLHSKTIQHMMLTNAKEQEITMKKQKDRKRNSPSMLEDNSPSKPLPIPLLQCPTSHTKIISDFINAHVPSLIYISFKFKRTHIT